jgi:hypothetical protein
MARYKISGENSTALDGTSTLTGQNLLGQNLGTDRVLWLKSAWFYNATTGVFVSLIDATAGTAAATTNRKYRVSCATGDTTQVTFPGPGLKFETGCCAVKDSTNASGSFGIGDCGGSGWEEGGP